MSVKRIFSPLIYATGLSLAVMAHPLQAENSPTDKAVAKTKPQEPQGLPNPLTLSLLLDSYANQAPQIELQKAQIDFAEANLQANQVENAWQADISGRLGRREFAEKSQAHNLLALHVGKVLYDFNRSATRYSADESMLNQEKAWLEAVQNQQRLQVVKAYFNVLLSDFQYRIDNEAMAIEYVGFDKVKDKHAIGQLSDVDLLKAEQEYQASLVKRMRAEQQQLQTRIELANVLGMPDERPDELKFPQLKNLQLRSIKGVSLEQLQKQVLQNNQQMQSLEMAKQARLLELENAKQTSSPKVRADAWLGQLSSHPEVREGRWKAALSVDVPLYDGGASQSATHKAKAELTKLNAQQKQLAQDLRSQVAEIYFQLKMLDAEKKQHLIFGDYADLYLDYSRALYENESSTDLGDAMVRLSEANYDMVAWEFKQALLWLELDYLLGQKVQLQGANPVAAKSKANNK